MPTPARILVVDDEDYLRRLCRDALEMNGHEVFTAANGAEALLLLRRERIDVIVSDVAMAPVDGIELYQCVCTEFPHLAKRFVLITAVVNVEERINGWQDPPLLLRKPFSLQALRAVVRSLLEPS